MDHIFDDNIEPYENVDDEETTNTFQLRPSLPSNAIIIDNTEEFTNKNNKLHRIKNNIIIYFGLTIIVLVILIINIVT